MAALITHPLVPIALAVAAGSSRVPFRLVALWLPLGAFAALAFGLRRVLERSAAAPTGA